MGADYIRRRARTFQKSWDLGALRIVESDLFTRDAGASIPSAITQLLPDARVNVGDRFIVRLDADRLHVYDGQRRIAECVAPAVAVRQYVERAGCIAEGRVLQLHGSARVAELELC